MNIVNNSVIGATKDLTNRGIQKSNHIFNNSYLNNSSVSKTAVNKRRNIPIVDPTFISQINKRDLDLSYRVN